jgi:hypothetical protein
MNSTEIVVCPECAGDIEIGIAIKPVYEYCCRPTPFDRILTHKEMKLMDVYKCKNCGHSYVETWEEY